MKQGIAHLVSITLISACVMFLNLGSARLWDRDEPRNAGCAKEMLDRGDWVTPIFNDELRDAKPVLLYWLIMSAYWMFGVTEFAARFWSAILAVSTVLMTYGMGRRLFSPKAGLWAALSLSSSLMFVVAGRAATPDSVLIFCVTGALTFYVFGTFKPRKQIASDPEEGEPSRQVRGAAANSQASAQANELTPTSANSAQGRSKSRKKTKRSQLPLKKPQPGDPAETLETVSTQTSQPPENDWQVEGRSVLANRDAFPTGNIAMLGTYGMMGLGMLAKGPVGVILPMAIIGMFMLVVRLPKLNPNRISELGFLGRLILGIIRPFQPWHFLKTVWAMRPFTALFMVLAIAGPWYILVGLRTDGDFLEGFFLKEHFGRATTSFENHSGPIYYYPLAILAGFFPWSVFALPLLLFVDRVLAKRDQLRQGDNEELIPDELHSDYHPRRLATLFACCWFVVWVGIFSIAETKLPSYVTPSYPALALLVGAFLTSIQIRTSALIRWWNRWAFTSLILVGVGLGVGLPLLAKELMPGMEWLGFVGIFPLLAGLIAWICFARQWWDGGRATLAMASVGFSVMLFGFGTVALDRFQTNDQIFAAIKSHQVDDTGVVASVGLMDSTWVYYLQQPIYELTIGPAGKVLENEEVESAKDQRKEAWLPKPRPDVQAFVAAHPEALLITTESQYEVIAAQLPADFEVLESTPHFLQDENLLLLGRNKTNQTADSQETETEFR